MKARRMTRFLRLNAWLHVRKPLTTAASRRIAAASSEDAYRYRQTGSTSALPARRQYWPNSRAVPSIPLAPPLRSRGAGDNGVIIRRLEQADPAPQRIIGQIIFRSEGGRQHDQRKQPGCHYHHSQRPQQTGMKTFYQVSRQRRITIVASGRASITGRFLLRYGPARFADKR